MVQDNRTLGQAIHEMRLKADFTLRAFAQMVNVSAAHMSDIEHSRRNPSRELLLKIASSLQHVGASIDYFNSLDSRIDPVTHDWISHNPEVSSMLRRVRESGRSEELLKEIEEIIRRRQGGGE